VSIAADRAGACVASVVKWLEGEPHDPPHQPVLLPELPRVVGVKPRLLDLFCGAGGAAMGYHRAGFEIVGVDIRLQPRFPFEFVQADALDVLRRMEWATWGDDDLRGVRLDEHFDTIHASPPCQFYAGLSRGDHWRSIPPTRELLEQTGLPYVIENIADARWDMRDPIRLCGSAFGLHVRRHRMFETTFPLLVPECRHEAQDEIRAYYGKPGWAAWTPKSAVVNGGDRKPLLRGSVEQAAEDMGIDWMDWDELREAIPPAYTSFIGEQLLSWLHASGRLPSDSLLERTHGTSASPDRKTGSHRSTDDPSGNASFAHSRLGVSAQTGASSPQSERVLDALD